MFFLFSLTMNILTPLICQWTVLQYFKMDIPLATPPQKHCWNLSIIRHLFKILSIFQVATLIGTNSIKNNIKNGMHIIG